MYGQAERTTQQAHTYSHSIEDVRPSSPAVSLKTTRLLRTVPRHCSTHSCLPSALLTRLVLPMQPYTHGYTARDQTFSTGSRSAEGSGDDMAPRGPRNRAGPDWCAVSRIDQRAARAGRAIPYADTLAPAFSRRYIEKASTSLPTSSRTAPRRRLAPHSRTTKNYVALPSPSTEEASSHSGNSLNGIWMHGCILHMRTPPGSAARTRTPTGDSGESSRNVSTSLLLRNEISAARFIS